MAMTDRQKRQLFEDGYVRIPGLIPPDAVRRALRAINRSIGENGIDPARLPTYRAQSYTPELKEDPAILGLYRAVPEDGRPAAQGPASAAWDVIESAIGPGKARIRGCQIALRFPCPDDRPRQLRPHIDGMYTPTNGVAEGTIAHFTALGCVLLSDLPEPWAGNFTVWPGSHHLYADYFRSHGPEALLAGMPPIDLPEPVQITGRAGDFILAHYLLGHGVAPNFWHQPRYAIFSRLRHVDHEAVGNRCMTEPWLEWEGMRHIAAEV